LNRVNVHLTMSKHDSTRDLSCLPNSSYIEEIRYQTIENRQKKINQEHGRFDNEYQQQMNILEQVINVFESHKRFLVRVFWKNINTTKAD
jgi:hypothetical protein